MLAAVYLPLVLLSAVVGMGLSLLAWVHRDTPGAGPLSLFLLVGSLLAITDGISLASPAYDATIYWGTLAHAIFALVPLAWLLTVLEYTGREDWLDPRVVAVLLVEPVAYSLLLWTNDAHSLVWTNPDTRLVGSYSTFVAEQGLAFWGHMLYAYVLVAIGAVVLVRLLWRTEDIFRAQSTALLAAIAAPMIVSALWAYDLLPVALDPTGLTVVVSGGVLAGAVLRGQLLSTSAAARELGREHLVAEMDDPVITIDTDGTIVDVNPAAERLLDTERSAVVGQSLAGVRPELAGAVEAGDRSGDAREVTLDVDGHTRYFDVRVSPFQRAYGAVTGRIVSLRDVTERTRREQRLDVMNRLLRHNLRNEMNVVRGNAELLVDGVEDPDLQGRAQRIIATVDEVIDRSEKVGTLSRSLDRDSPEETVDLRQLLESAATAARNSFPEATVDVDIEGAREAWPIAAGPAVEIALTELLENAAEHGSTDGRATVTARLRGEDDSVTLTVADEGPGIPEQELSVIQTGTETPLQHGSGIGLWMVVWVVERAGGRIDFDAGADGTTVTVTFSRAGAS